MASPENSLPEDADAAGAGRGALDDLFSLTYEELRQRASAVRNSEASAPVTTTALVHETWLKLKDSPQLGSLPPAHFKSIAAKAMRQIIVDAARRKNAQKRGGGDAPITLQDSAGAMARCAEEVLALNAALEELAKFSLRQARLVECRFFGGLSVAETASALRISESSVEREWRAARAWLSRKLSGG